MQHYICSHCVAAAENNGSLEAFVKNYGAYAKTPKGQKAITPNFTRLGLTRQTAGRKGGKAPPKKTISRRRTIPTTATKFSHVTNTYNTYISDESFNKITVNRSCSTFPQLGLVLAWNSTVFSFPHHRIYHLLEFHHSLIFLNIALLTHVMK